MTFLLISGGCRIGSPAVEGDSVKPLISEVLPLKKTLRTIAFGSCNKQNKPQHIWGHILRHEPDLWIWAGDNIYADTRNMRKLREQYLKQKAQPEYKAFREEVPVIGIWDDHDYGKNDAGNEYPAKKESRDLLLNFLDVPADAPVWDREGAYQSYTFGPRGRQVMVILLDTRYFRDPLRKGPLGYLPRAEGSILGAAQWAWLEETLEKSTAQLHIIVSSIQLIPEEHPFEKWANLPKERQRFFEMLVDIRPARPLIISGDRHIAELSSLRLPRLESPLYELTASGMTHTWSSLLGKDEPNAHRLGDLIVSKNFGLLHIDWSGKEPRVKVEVRSDEDVGLLKLGLDL